MRKALIITGLVTGLTVGAFMGFIGTLANVHDGYTQSEAIRDYSLWFLVHLPAGGFLGYLIGRLNALAIDYMRRNLGRGIGVASLLILSIVLTLVAAISFSALLFWLFYPLGH